VVKFTGVELTGNSGNPVTITFPQPKTIDLLNQSGTASAVLFDQPIPAGKYGQIRLIVVADGDPSNSYMTLSDGTMHGLQVPDSNGLKLVSGFTVPSSGVVDYTIDFDLRKAITCPTGQAPACTLKPAERLVDNTTVGNIQGCSGQHTGTQRMHARRLSVRRHGDCARRHGQHGCIERYQSAASLKGARREFPAAVLLPVHVPAARRLQRGLLPARPTRTIPIRPTVPLRSTRSRPESPSRLSRQ